LLNYCKRFPFVVADDTLVPLEDENDDDVIDNQSVCRTSQRDFESVLNDEEHVLHPHPKFWLFLQITEELVNVYFHHRYGVLGSTQNVEVISKKCCCFSIFLLFMQ